MDNGFYWVSDFLNRKIHKTLTKKILGGVNNDQLEQTVVDNIMNKFNKNFTTEYEVLSQLSKGRVLIYTSWCLEAEINNGGFIQYFYNSTGELAYLALEGLEQLGAVEHANLLRRALVLLELNEDTFEKLRSENLITSFVEARQEVDFSSFDEEFYELEKNQTLSELRINYIRQSLTEFVD
ncbi:hypothetical protein C9994_03915 [Marivirga lumbricoides]|uniref:DNA mimic protein DMP19 C-terminal domain-containing protein n=1 Tax=Marivirga lumbricoides TaxID=1046115 RepID=A0A2T4DTR2_9BACT|nr:hypothetical protein C9994_03915 [Marivirga lumbricoides]